MSDSIRFTIFSRFGVFFKNPLMEVTLCHVHYYTQITNFTMAKSEEVGNTRHYVMVWCHNVLKKKTKDEKTPLSLLSILIW